VNGQNDAYFVLDGALLTRTYMYRLLTCWCLLSYMWSQVSQVTVIPAP